MTESLMHSHTDGIRAALEHFVPIAVGGLARMVTDDGRWFCFRARRGTGGSLNLEGRSERYSAMSLIGLSSCTQTTGLVAGTGPVELGPIVDALHDWAPTAVELGDAGLVLWSELLREDARAEATLTAILRRRDAIHALDYGLPSMETGFLLLGLSAALRHGLGGTPLQTFAADVAAKLAANQDESTGLFSFGRKLRRKNVHRARQDTRLGSFASQVYPTMAFAAFARTSSGDAGDSRAATIARHCAERLCDLQGSEGQWWWVYHTTGSALAV